MEGSPHSVRSVCSTSSRGYSKMWKLKLVCLGPCQWLSRFVHGQTWSRLWRHVMALTGLGSLSYKLDRRDFCRGLVVRRLLCRQRVGLRLRDFRHGLNSKRGSYLIAGSSRRALEYLFLVRYVLSSAAVRSAGGIVRILVVGGRPGCSGGIAHLLMSHLFNWLVGVTSVVQVQ